MFAIRNKVLHHVYQRRVAPFDIGRQKCQDAKIFRISIKRRECFTKTVFIDLFSRIVVGWDLSDSLERHSAIRALNKAIMRRRPGKGLMVHSDRGIQYASNGFRKVLQKHGFVQSMSRKGNCWDNAVAESFFHSIKTQLIHHVRFQNRMETEHELYNYIEVYFNRR